MTFGRMAFQWYSTLVGRERIRDIFTIMYLYDSLHNLCAPHLPLPSHDL